MVRTQYTSEAADKAQHGVMELLLINHPLDCPVCDKGGECPLQNQAMSNGRAETRFTDVKRTFPKPINLSSQVLLDRERCVLCARCTRFSDQIAGDPFIELLERGALQQVGIAPGEPFDSYFSGNTVQICPVGALTGTAYRFRARPFDLVSSPASANTAPRAAPSAPTTAAAWCCAGWPATTRRSTRSGTATRAAGRSPTPGSATGSPPRWCATTTARCVRPPGRRPSRWPPPGLAGRPDRGAGRRPGHRRGRLRLRQVRPNGAGHQRHRLPRPAALGGGDGVPDRPGRRSRATSATPTWRRRRWCCWPDSNPRRSRRSSSCGCARRSASAACR